jgi:hypothetical protein
VHSECLHFDMYCTCGGCYCRQLYAHPICKPGHMDLLRSQLGFVFGEVLSKLCCKPFDNFAVRKQNTPVKCAMRFPSPIVFVARPAQQNTLRWQLIVHDETYKTLLSKPHTPKTSKCIEIHN